MEGRTPPSIRAFFYGVNLIALQKSDGSVRPIAVGCTLRCLAAKVAGIKVMGRMNELLGSHQLGCGVTGEMEAAVHAARLYLQDLDSLKAVMKLDFRNVFNTIYIGTRCC